MPSASNRPDAAAGTLDDVEHVIVERIEVHKQDSHSIHLEQLHIYDARLAALNFQERFAIIRQAAPEAVGDFGAEAGLGGDELFELLRRLKESEDERENFRKRHRIFRPARLSTPGKVLLKLGLLAVLFVIEVAVMAGFCRSRTRAASLAGCR